MADATLQADDSLSILSKIVANLPNRIVFDTVGQVCNGGTNRKFWQNRNVEFVQFQFAVQGKIWKSWSQKVTLAAIQNKSPNKITVIKEVGLS